MRLLLDTHVLIWLDLESQKVPPAVAHAIRSRETACFLSWASVWELTIKQSRGLLKLATRRDDLAASYVRAGRLSMLPMASHHFSVLAQLPYHHRDPFDRLLIAQAISEDLRLVSADHAFADYNVQFLWN